MEQQEKQYTVNSKQALAAIQDAVEKADVTLQAKPTTILRENIRSVKHNHPLTRRAAYPRLSYRRKSNQIFYNAQELGNWIEILIAANSVVEGIIGDK